MKTISKLPDILFATELLDAINFLPCLKDPRIVDKPIVLYGAGDMGKMAYEYFKIININIEFVIDKQADKFKTDLFWSNTRIIDPIEGQAFIDKDFLLVVCVALSPYEEIQSYLNEMGWKDIVPLYDICEAYKEIHPLSNGWFANNLNSQDYEQMRNSLSMWQDDISRAHYIQFYAWHKLREDWIFEKAPIINNRYFIPEVLGILNSNESFLDIGAHHGQVIRKFFDLKDGLYKEIVAIEADSNNCEVLRKNLTSYGIINNVHIKEMVLSDKRIKKPFLEGLGYSSQFSQSSKNLKETILLDDLDLKPTFIKMHLEGYELEVLKGALNTIVMNNPILAITVYHNTLGLWEIFNWLKDNLKNYRFYLRLHSWVGTGLVVYCLKQ